MTDWLIATPVWGERCLSAFETYVVPAIKAAASKIDGKVRFVVHTDQPFRLDGVLGSFGRRILPVPEGANAWVKAGAANREALREAQMGEAVAFINADMVPSVEVTLCL